MVAIDGGFWDLLENVIRRKIGEEVLKDFGNFGERMEMGILGLWMDSGGGMNDVEGWDLLL